MLKKYLKMGYSYLHTYYEPLTPKFLLHNQNTLKRILTDVNEIHSSGVEGIYMQQEVSEIAYMIILI
jgi:hypothetical protein